MTVRSLIDRHLADFSASDTRVARLILEKYPVSALGGIEDIARQSSVSAPTVTRFVKRLGFKRFADFQRAIRLEVQDSEASPLALFRKHQSLPAKRSDRDRMMVEQLSDSLCKLLETPTQRAIDKAAVMLGNARSRIYLLGGRWSSAAAQYAAFQLTSLRGEVHVLAPQASGLHEDRIADFGRRDVLVAYDFRRYQPETIAFCQTAKQRGVQLVLFTDLDLSPIADIADVVIPVTVESTSPLETLAVALAATDALLGRLVRKLGPQANRRMAMLEVLRRDANIPKLPQKDLSMSFTSIPAIDAPGGAYRERPIELRKTALLSVDMQNAEWSPERMTRARVPGSPEAGYLSIMEKIEHQLIPNQQRLQAAARKAGIEVIYTTIESYTLDGRDRSLDHKISNLFCPKGSWEAQVISKVGPEPNDIVIPKTASGIFNSTNIEYVLRNLGIEYLVIYGICTDQCVECAIRDAADRGFLVTQIEDACAAVEEPRHYVSIAQMRGHYCRTRTTGEMIAEIEALSRSTAA